MNNFCIWAIIYLHEIVRKKAGRIDYVEVGN